jgi:hypothetical protein
MICADRHNNDRSGTVENTVLDNQFKRIDEIQNNKHAIKRIKKIIRIVGFFSTDIDSNEIKRVQKKEGRNYRFYFYEIYANQIIDLNFN